MGSRSPKNPDPEESPAESPPPDPEESPKASPPDPEENPAGVPEVLASEPLYRVENTSKGAHELQDGTRIGPGEVLRGVRQSRLLASAMHVGVILLVEEE